MALRRLPFRTPAGRFLIMFWNPATRTFVALTGQMQLRVLATSNGSFDDLRVLEAGIDDVEVVAACRTRFNGSAGMSAG